MSAVDYETFLDSKRIQVTSVGFEVSANGLHPALFDFQRDITRWALQKGRAAIFEGTGLGKTFQQLVWSDQVMKATNGNILIFAPLAVAEQTIREGARWGIQLAYAHDQSEVRPGITITNYERIDRFEPFGFAGIVLDESGILKGIDSKTRILLNEITQQIPYRLCCTATPAPNDLLEIVNHAEFLGVLTVKEAQARFFSKKDDVHTWSLKGHAHKEFWKWVAGWAVAVRRPSDIDPSYDDSAYNLPPLHIHQETVDAQNATFGLFAVEALTLQERQAARRVTTDDRVARMAEIVAREPDEPWLIWCGLNKESEALRKAIPGAVEVKGADSIEHKKRSLLGFAEGDIPILVSKASICGFGLNLQRCARIGFVGLSDSFEEYYQAIRRCWRFGQTRDVHCYVVTAETEGAVVQNIQRKERDAEALIESLVREMRGLSIVGQTTREVANYDPQLRMEIPAWFRKVA